MPATRPHTSAGLCTMKHAPVCLKNRNRATGQVKTMLAVFGLASCLASVFSQEPIPPHPVPKENVFQIPPLIKPPESDSSNSGAGPADAVPIPEMPPDLFPTRPVGIDFPDAPPKSKKPKSNKLAPPGRWMHSTVIVESQVIVYGGVANSASLLNDLWVYNTEEGSWYELEPPTVPIMPTTPNPLTKTSMDLEGRPPDMPAPPPMIRPPGVPPPPPETTSDNAQSLPKKLKYLRIPPVPVTIPLQPESTLVTENIGKFLETEEHVRRAGSKAALEARRLQHAGFKSKLLANTKGKEAAKEDPITDPTPQTLNDLWVYLIAERIWIQPKPVALQPPPRWLHSAVAKEDKEMFVFGGCSNNMQLLNDMWSFKMTSLENPLWKEYENTQIKAWPTPREGHSMALISSNLIIFGGVSYGYVPYNDVWKFSTMGGSFTELDKGDKKLKKDYPEARWMHSVVVIQDSMKKDVMVVFGGCSTAYAPLGDTWIGKVGSTGVDWIKLPKSPQQIASPAARWLHAAAPLPLPSFAGSDPDKKGIDYAMIVHGGSCNNAPQEDMWLLSFAKDDITWMELHESGASPWARTGHTAMLIGPPPSSTRARRRRLLSTTTNQLGLDMSIVPPVTDAVWIERRMMDAMNGPTQKKLYNPRFPRHRPQTSAAFWVLVFGGATEKGLVNNVQSGDGIFV